MRFEEHERTRCRGASPRFRQPRPHLYHFLTQKLEKVTHRNRLFFRTQCGEQFGQLRIEDCVARLATRSSQEIVEGLVQAVLEWTGERGPNDDLTLVVLKTLGA